MSVKFLEFHYFLVKTFEITQWISLKQNCCWAMSSRLNVIYKHYDLLSLWKELRIKKRTKTRGISLMFHYPISWIFFFKFKLAQINPVNFHLIIENEITPKCWQSLIWLASHVCLNAKCKRSGLQTYIYSRFDFHRFPKILVCET